MLESFLFHYWKWLQVKTFPEQSVSMLMQQRPMMQVLPRATKPVAWMIKCSKKSLILQPCLSNRTHQTPCKITVPSEVWYWVLYQVVPGEWVQMPVSWCERGWKRNKRERENRREDGGRERRKGGGRRKKKSSELPPFEIRMSTVYLIWYLRSLEVQFVWTK